MNLFLFWNSKLLKRVVELDCDLAKILETSKNIEAHHIMPWEICRNNEIVQLAALDGFHPNLLENRIGLKKYNKLVGAGMHGNHPAYDAFVKSKEGVP